MSTRRGEDLALAHRLADAADAITLARYQAIDLSIATKPDNTPFETDPEPPSPLITYESRVYLRRSLLAPKYRP